MRKILFLLLFLVVLGAAGTNQVRIGGDGAPNDAAVLDLNVDDDTNDGTKGLALPRVQLESDDAKLDGVTDNLDGMLVYNTSGSLPAGVYFWNGSNWIMGLTELQKKIYSFEFTATGCGSGAVGTQCIFDMSKAPLPSWYPECNTSNSWLAASMRGHMYGYGIEDSYLKTVKLYSTSLEPKFTLFCYF